MEHAPLGRRRHHRYRHRHHHRRHRRHRRQRLHRRLAAIAAVDVPACARHSRSTEAATPDRHRHRGFSHRRHDRRHRRQRPHHGSSAFPQWPPPLVVVVAYSAAVPTTVLGAMLPSNGAVLECLPDMPSPAVQAMDAGGCLAAGALALYIGALTRRCQRPGRSILPRENSTHSLHTSAGSSSLRTCVAFIHAYSR